MNSVLIKKFLVEKITINRFKSIKCYIKCIYYIKCFEANDLILR